MDIKKIKELLLLMEETGTKRLVIKQEGVEIELEKESRHPAPYQIIAPLESNPMKKEMEDHLLTSSPSNQETKVQQEEETGSYITSPMVGTFYASPSPEDPPFIQPGDKVIEGMTVCIVEAMKVMNEVKADHSGIIERIFVESGHPVEFGTKLFLIR